MSRDSLHSFKNILKKELFAKFHSGKNTCDIGK